MHANTGEANFNESMYFNFYDRQARVGAFARIGNRPNERYAEMTIAVYQPDGTALFNYKRPEIADNSAFAAGGMRFDVVEPFKHLARRLRRQRRLPRAAAGSRGSAPRVHQQSAQPVSLALDWYGLSPMYGGDAAASSSEMVFAKRPLRAARPRRRPPDRGRHDARASTASACAIIRGGRAPGSRRPTTAG